MHNSNFNHNDSERAVVQKIKCPQSSADRVINVKLLNTSTFGSSAAFFSVAAGSAFSLTSGVEDASGLGVSFKAKERF